jgi:hypothetical protein
MRSYLLIRSCAGFITVTTTNKKLGQILSVATTNKKLCQIYTKWLINKKLCQNFIKVTNQLEV